MGSPDTRVSTAPSCATWKVALYVLLISLWAAAAWNAGETCRRWLEGIPIPVDVFLCPEKSDGADAKFCCGPCSRTYCCSSMAARLDQRECFHAGPPKAPTTEGSTPAAPEPEWLYTVFLLVLAIAVTLGVCALVRGIKCCKRRQGQIPAAVAHLPPARLSPEDPSRQASPDLPPPYSPYETPAPPYSLEDPQGSWIVPPPYPGDSSERQHPNPGVPDDGAVTFFPMGALLVRVVPGNALENRLDHQ